MLLSYHTDWSLYKFLLLSVTIEEGLNQWMTFFKVLYNNKPRFNT